MPEDTVDSTDVRTKALEELENYSLDDHVYRSHSYRVMQNAVENDLVDAETLQRLLVVCVHDSTSLKYTTTVINVISAILSKVKFGKYQPALDFVPSAMAIMNMIKTIALYNKVESLVVLSYQTLLSYPEETLIAITEQYEELIEIFILYCHVRVPKSTRAQALIFLHKLLKILPAEQKRVFIEKGVSVWFSKIIPMIMAHLTVQDDDSDMALETVEMLTDELIYIDYDDNLHWHTILESICNTKQYPAMMKSHLQVEFRAWYRLWIVLVRLLKHQVTLPLKNVGTPINSLLPVVEAAFKMEAPRRCEAFKCWNVLIDSFSTETNESNISKRIKLLIIPLKSNNAKTEDVALAKFNCWWHLICKFQNKMDKFLDTVLISFLHFCFGRHIADRSALVPGLLSIDMKKHCSQAIVDVIGHVNCDGCTSLPKLKSKLITTKHLVDNWNNWIYSITSVIMRTTSISGLTEQQLTCLWKSFLRTIGELPENNIRKDLFSEVLSIASDLLKSCKSSEFLSIVFDCIVLSLFAEDTQIKQLFKSNHEPTDPIIRAVMILVNTPTLDKYYENEPTKDMVTKLKPFTALIFDDSICTPRNITNCILEILPPSDSALIFWMALVESMCESKYDKCLLVLHKVLLWPLKHIPQFTNIKIPAITWYTTYISTYPKVNKTEIDKEILEILYSLPEGDISSVYFKLCVILGVLKYSFNENTYMNCEKEINYLQSLIKSIDNYSNFEAIFPILVDKIVAIMTIVTRNINENITALILICVKNLLFVLSKECTKQSDVTHHMLLMEHLLKPVDKLLAVPSYSKLVPAMIYHLLKCAPLLAGHFTTQTIILSIMKTILLSIKVSHPNYSNVKSLIDDIENRKFTTEATEINPENNQFTTPQTKEVPKCTKKKEPNIVNTVVENGEEYVVVKSNWKFNPRKLTENQKEKFQRKREDIPALYQDLSQSQDEFKLVSWKTDSQDTTSSSKSESKSSKTNATETATEILKNIPSTNVVPKILENFFSERDKTESGVKDPLPKDNIISKVDVTTPSTKNTKSPRMALKDRVFRNVRNLIENSGLQKENKELSDDHNKTVNTPTHTKTNNSVKVVNSAPPLLSADRPSRVKRKPKKFEDLELLISKRNRHSLHDVNSDKTKQENGEELTTIDNSSGGKDITTGENNVLPSSGTPQDTDDTNKNMLTTDYVNMENNMDIDDTNKNMLTTDNDSNIINDENAIRNEENQNLESDVIMVESDTNEEQCTQQVTKLTQAKELPTPSASKLFSYCVGENESKDAKNIEETISENVNEAILSTSKTFEDVSKLSSSSKQTAKDITTSTAPRPDKEVATPFTSKDVMVVINSKTSKPIREDSTSSISKDVKEVSSPKTPKTLKEVTTPGVSKSLKGMSTPSSSKTVKEASTPKSSKPVKDITTPRTSRHIKEVSIPKSSNNTKEILTPRSSKVNKEILTPKTSKDIKEISAPKTSKDINEISTPKTSIDIKETLTSKTSNDTKEIWTPKSFKNIEDVSTPKSTKNSLVLIPKVSIEVTELLTPQGSKILNHKISNEKELAPNSSKDDKEVSTPKQTTPKQTPKGDEQKLTAKKSTVKKSRIEKELAIDTVEGHPYLKIHSAKRLTRKALESASTGRRKSLAAKLNKSKSEVMNILKSDRKHKDKNKESENTSSTTVDESQERDSEQKEDTSFSQELPFSDDVIESSQDSTITTISVKSMKKAPARVPVVCVEKMVSPGKIGDINISQSILDHVAVDVHKSPSSNNESKDDTVLPLNKTVLEEKTQDDLTENMDTEPLEEDISEDVILINDEVPAVTIASDDTIPGPETQEIAEADTQPTDSEQFMDIDETQENIPDTSKMPTKVSELCNIEIVQYDVRKDQPITTKLDVNNSVNNTTLTLSDSAYAEIEKSTGASSPFKDEVQRQKDFLNNTIEISPIKTMSPERHKKSPSPETSGDYVVITLSSPVHSNGEPFHKCGSPEVFTEDKVSPDKRDQSPPRVEISVTNTSPSSSLSLKKNRPQVRSGGRAAQMLGLCVPDKVQAIVNPERNESEEIKKSNSMNTPARRNLRILYNTANDNNTESSNSASENDDSDHFLKFRRSLPTVDSSPSGPILKRKLAEITDDALVSPASKRKRVSFHDPPVSTTISVQRYIEPGALRSPQNSAQKRMERRLRYDTVPVKSPKRLDNAFKLDTVLTKTVESFCDNDIVPISDDTQQFSLDETPVVEIIRVSELDDTDPICPELLDCKDSVENIAGELSSPAMKSLLVKELEGKIETVGDLAKMTELEVNRLCIKAPKVKIAKKVLGDYVAKRAEQAKSDMMVTLDVAEFDEPMTESEVKGMNREVQTDTNVSIDIEVQTVEVATRFVSAQTDVVPTTHTSIQTEESGSKSTSDIIKTCLSEKKDFVELLSTHLEETSIQQLSEKLSLSIVTDLLMKRITPSDTKSVLNRLLTSSLANDRSKELSLIRDLVSERFESKDLILLCSQILKNVYDKSV